MKSAKDSDVAAGPNLMSLNGATGITNRNQPSPCPVLNSVAQRVTHQAMLTPDALAVSSSQACLSYDELDVRSNELGNALRSMGVGPEIAVALHLPRSPAMVVGALGILKAGGAYVPIDPSYPEARLAFLLEDAHAPVVVTGKAGQESAIGARAHGSIVLDESGRLSNFESHRPERADFQTATLRDLAYIIYTSGSTGQPKGVEVTHASLLNLVSWHQAAFGVSQEDRASQVARVGFDAAVWEIWPYLCAGGSVHAADEALLSDPEALQEWILSTGITIAFIPTPMAERLMALPWPVRTALRLMLTGGDTLHSFTPKELPFALVNNYGPTECTVVATSAVVASRDCARGLPPIGFPIQNTKAYVLDQSKEPVPEGAAGELYLGGAGLARGYRNRPDLTAERFIRNPFSTEPGERLFKTGDIVKSLPDGQLAFLGRTDDQIKVRGFRIEPNEVAAALNEHPEVLQSVVTAPQTSPGERRLIAYFVPAADARPTLSELHAFLSARLPEFMVPAIFVVLADLPLSPNGKVDRNALPVPDSANTLRDAGVVSPRTDVESAVADILKQLLQIGQLDVNDNFFVLGGHSLLGTQIIVRVRERFGVELALRHVFEAPTVAGISAEVERQVAAVLDSMSEEQANSLLDSLQS
jgi:amino acid adenylation domain-containing protein